MGIPLPRIGDIMISGFLDGLDILKKYDTEPPIVTSAYIITIPKIKQADITGPGDQAAMDAAGWLVHPVYECHRLRQSRDATISNPYTPTNHSANPIRSSRCQYFCQQEL